MRLLCVVFAMSFALLIARTTVRAQGPGLELGPTSAVPSLNGSGSETIRRQPDTLRMTVELQARGSTTKDALASLEQRRQKAMDQLAKLGANEASIKFGEPTMSTGQTPQELQMQQFYIQQARSRGVASVKTPDVARVTRNLSAEWPLEAKTTEELLIAASELTKKIRDADLGGTKEADKLTPEEEELAEETEEYQVQMGMQPGASPGQPKFVYMKTISAEERAKAIGRAYQMARKQAAELAAATDTKLGRLWSVVVRDDNSSVNMHAGSWQYNPYGNQLYAPPEFDRADGQYAAIGTAPGELTFRVHVQAAFAFEEAE